MNRSDPKRPRTVYFKNKESSTLLRSILHNYRQSHERREKLPLPLPPAYSLPCPSLSKYDFKFLQVLGRSSLGRVWEVEHKHSRQFFLLREMLKLRIISKKQLHRVLNEQKVLESLQSPFIVNMHYALQDNANLYLVLDLLRGGDLRYHLKRLQQFSEEATKFIAACIVTGLESLHNSGIIHRDIKPENLVLDYNGYVRITNFGIACSFTPENAKDTSGTPGYMAPEVMARQDHGAAVDYFALGVLLYEFIMGRRPYIGRSKGEIRDQIFSKQVRICRDELPEHWSQGAADFVNQLLRRRSSQRLCNSRAVKSHV